MAKISPIFQFYRQICQNFLVQKHCTKVKWVEILKRYCYDTFRLIINVNGGFCKIEALLLFSPKKLLGIFREEKIGWKILKIQIAAMFPDVSQRDCNEIWVNFTRIHPYYFQKVGDKTSGRLAELCSITFTDICYSELRSILHSPFWALFL